MKQEIKEWAWDSDKDERANEQFKAWLIELMKTHIIVSIVTTEGFILHDDVTFSNSYTETALVIAIDKKSYN